jgi:hypothetical protein
LKQEKLKVFLMAGRYKKRKVKISNLTCEVLEMVRVLR